MNETVANNEAKTPAKRVGAAVWYLLLPLLILAVWEFVCHTGIFQSYTMPTPEAVIRAAVDGIRDGSLAKHIGASFLRVLEGFLIAAACALALGVVTGLSKKAECFFELVIQILKPIPPIAWIPLAILWFGIGEPSKLFIIFLGAFFPILLNTVSGIHNLDGKYLELARVYEVDKLRLVTKIILPGALPEILTGIRVGLGNAWVCVVAAEMITMLQTVITRETDPHQDALLTLGKISGGTSHNVIADEVRISGTLRTFSDDLFQQMLHKCRALVQGLEVATGAKISSRQIVYYPCVENPRALVERIYALLDSMEDTVLVEPAMAAEDFAEYQREVPGVFCWLGIQGGKGGAALHNTSFDFDEDALLTGVELFRRILTE